MEKEKRRCPQCANQQSLVSLSLSLSLSLRSSSWLRLAAAEHGLVARDQSTVRGAT